MSLRNFFCPDSVAVIGAAREEEKVGHAILDNIINSGYKGKLFAINPKADEIHCIQCYPSILKVPINVDLAIIVIPVQYVLQALLGRCVKEIPRELPVAWIAGLDGAPLGAVQPHHAQRAGGRAGRPASGALRVFDGGGLRA